MDSASIRRKFLDFFRDKQHQIVPSAPMVVKNDPTLMFTNAGMNQFKDYFLGNQVAPYNRAADTQKCLRVSGKHNDLEEVGIDTYHHTMFEMLGNWSFGNYFKKEAIEWAWELLTKEYGLPPERLYATVFEGDEGDGLPADDEALKLWQQFLPNERILYGSKKDNFWEMGDQGPCGPCSELHIDLRPEADIAQKPGQDLVNMDHPLVVEIWNLVFIQFNRLANSSLEPLPAKHIDTGMGFERLCMAIQNKTSNYETDVFTPLISFIANKAGVTYGQDESIDIALRVVVDHVRAVAFAIADGQLPSNNRAGYVIRRILRRAVRYGYTFLNFDAPFLNTLVPVLASQMEEFFPELKAQESFIVKVITEEEAGFLRTLDKGLKRLEQIKETLPAKGTIDGKIAFELYDTFGFPLDLTALIARENDLQVDEAGFDAEMEQQKQRSKQAAQVETGDWVQVNPGEDVTFLGYDQTEAEARILKYRQVKEKKKTLYQVVLDQTPFYAESGGQVGDSGTLTSDAETLKVLDTRKENDLIVHFTDKLPQATDQVFKASINTQRRQNIKNNHSATHLLHAALRQVLGSHVQQKGSLVAPELLRFDFSHFAKMTPEEIRQVEDIVNQRVRMNIALQEQRNVPIEQAKEQGAMALFGEKYGDFVRVIIFDKDYSVELCGGTHVPATGHIGYFKIVSEGSVAAGVRRIEALTATAANNHAQEQEDTVQQLKELLKNPKDLLKAVSGLMEERNQMGKSLEKLHQEQAARIKESLIEQAQQKNGVNAVIAKVELPDADSLKKLSFELRQQLAPLYMVLAANINGKPQVAIMLSDDLVEKHQLNAGQMVRQLAKHIQGGGGGQAFFATAGGKNAQGLDAVVQAATQDFEALFTS